KGPKRLQLRMVPASKIILLEILRRHSLADLGGMARFWSRRMPATEVSIPHQPPLARPTTAHTSDSQACSPGSRPITFTGRLSRRRRPTREGDQVLGF